MTTGRCSIFSSGRKMRSAQLSKWLARTAIAVQVAAVFVLSLLHEHGCDHVDDFPQIVKNDWPENDQSAASAVKAFRKGF